MDYDDDDIPLASMATTPKVKKEKKKDMKGIKVKGDNNDSSNKKRKREDDTLINNKKKMKKKLKDSDSTPSTVKSSNSKGKASDSKKELKKLDKAERLQYAMQSFLWWNAKEPPEGCQWVTMEHAGVSFPESYRPHGVKLKYEGRPIDLTPVQEEA